MFGCTYRLINSSIFLAKKQEYCEMLGTSLKITQFINNFFQFSRRKNRKRRGVQMDSA